MRAYRGGAGFVAAQRQQQLRLCLAEGGKSRSKPGPLQRDLSDLPSRRHVAGWQERFDACSKHVDLYDRAFAVLGSMAQRDARFREYTLVSKERHRFAQRLTNFDLLTNSTFHSVRGRWTPFVRGSVAAYKQRVEGRHRPPCVLILWGSASCGFGSPISRPQNVPYKSNVNFFRKYYRGRAAVLVVNENCTSQICPRCLAGRTLEQARLDADQQLSAASQVPGFGSLKREVWRLKRCRECGFMLHRDAAAASLIGMVGACNVFRCAGRERLVAAGFSEQQVAYVGSD